jgi:chromosome segregation ATPase
METRSINELNQEIDNLQEQLNDQKENVKNERELRQLEIEQIQLYMGIVDDQKQQIASLQSEIETLKGDAKQVHELVNKLSKECVFAERRKEQLQDELERVKGENAGIGNLLKASIERNQQCYSIEHIEQALHDNGLSRRGKLVVDNLKASKEGKGCE